MLLVHSQDTFWNQFVTKKPGLWQSHHTLRFKNAATWEDRRFVYSRLHLVFRVQTLLSSQLLCETTPVRVNSLMWNGRKRRATGADFIEDSSQGLPSLQWPRSLVRVWRQSPTMQWQVILCVLKEEEASMVCIYVNARIQYKQLLDMLNAFFQPPINYMCFIIYNSTYHMLDQKNLVSRSNETA